MTWKKDTYYITTLDDNNERIRETVSGVVSQAGPFPIGIHKAGDAAWFTTDIQTGYLLNTQTTKRAAMQWVEDNTDIIVEMLSKPAHAALVIDIEGLPKR